MKNGSEAFDRLLNEYDDVRSVLDIGSGDGTHAKILRAAGKTVFTVSLEPPADRVGNYMDCDFMRQFDAIWASHVLEHQVNVNAFLIKCFNDLRMGGVLAITVPPLKHNIVGGHVTLWNAGLLLYNLILAGFDCSEARVGEYGYNISVIVRKKKSWLHTLRYDNGDIDKLSPYFPCEVSEGFDGRLPSINW